MISVQAIFIMTNKFSTNPDEEDAKTILQQFTIQKYLRLRSNAADNSAVVRFVLDISSLYYGDDCHHRRLQKTMTAPIRCSVCSSFDLKTSDIWFDMISLFNHYYFHFLL